MRFYKTSNPIKVFLPYRYHIEKFSEGSYDWYEISCFHSYRNAKIEFDRLKEEYPSLHFRLIATLELI